MDVMLLFDIVILIFGVYMVFSALKMKKTGVISSAVITPEEIVKCKDKQGFIAFMYWKEALFGGLVAIIGGLGIVNDVVVSLGAFNVVEMLVFLAAFSGFKMSCAGHVINIFKIPVIVIQISQEHHIKRII